MGQVEGVVKEREQEAEGLRAQLAQAVELYRASLLAAAPDIPEELVNGATIAEVEASLAQARQMVEQVRGQLEAKPSRRGFRLALRRVPLRTSRPCRHRRRYGWDWTVASRRTAMPLGRRTGLLRPLAQRNMMVATHRQGESGLVTVKGPGHY